MPKSSPKCKKCNDTKWYAYDENHRKICEECCKHDNGFWLLTENFGKNNGKLCCNAGCGFVKENDEDRIAFTSQAPEAQPNTVVVRCTHSPLRWLLAGILIILIMELGVLPRAVKMCEESMRNVIVNN